ncbi:hypothetical protein [Sphingobium sp.]|uniref:hypothetical protein n=1 Tax=Sphingobium sp. TaxID=1912891 RepID=UPI0025DA9DB8|nr:hypothetical protein [Sphingobium sp.]
MRFLNTFDRWLGRLSGLATFWPALPVAVSGLVTAKLSESVVWIARFGAFGWWCAFVTGVLAGLASATLFAVFKERMARAHAITKWSKEVDNINPLDDQFTRKRIRISDLEHPTTHRIAGKRFIDCQLVGPATIAFLNQTHISGIGFINCDLIPTKDVFFAFNPIGVERTQIIGGQICNATIYLHPSILKSMEADGMHPYYPVLTGNTEIDARLPRSKAG